MSKSIIPVSGENLLPDELKKSGNYFHAEQRGSIFPCCKTEEDLIVMRQRNNPDDQSVGHFTGRCSYCGSNNLWDDNLAYGCNDCGAMLGGN